MWNGGASLLVLVVAVGLFCFVQFKNELLPSHLEDNPPTGKDNTSQVQGASRLVLAEYIYNIYILFFLNA